jgi:hypothetical protein
MTEDRPSNQEPCYDIRLAGHLDDHWSTWFGNLTIIHEGDGTTTLRGPVVDQAELHGLLIKVRNLGATLISLAPVDTGSCQVAQLSLLRAPPTSRSSSARQHQPPPRRQRTCPCSE